MKNSQEVKETNLTHLTPISSEGNEGNLVRENFQNLTSEEQITDGQSALDLIENHLRNNYYFRFNQVFGRIEFKTRTDSEYEWLTDYKFNSMNRGLLKRQIRTSKDILKSIIHSDFVSPYNPFTDYFNNLPEWDGTTDYIKQLAETIKTGEDEFWLKCFRKWIVATVGCSTVDKITNQTAIIFIGKQGIGKTKWMLKLLPVALKDYFYSGIPNLKNKDTKIRMAECFLINLDEMDCLTSANTERLKEIITATEIKERRPYGYFDETMPRRASFMGSVNNKQFLNDTTGNRRFLCFEVNQINYEHNINMDMVYAQAKALFDNGFQYFFNPEEIEEVSEHNEQFQIVSYLEELILKWFVPINAETEIPQHKWTSTEIAQYLSEKSNFLLNDANIQKIGRYLKKHKFARIKNADGNYAYAVNEKPQLIQILKA
jgi:predicted P-loop ATPase